MPTKKVLLSLALIGLTASGCLYPVGYGVRVGFGPPPFRAEVAVGSPGPGYYWVPGYYDWVGARYAWISGRWVVPPHPRAVWVAPRYERRGGAYYYHRGHWR